MNRNASLVIIIATLLLSAATNAISATPKLKPDSKPAPKLVKPSQPDWQKEPSSFMGIEFGRPLSEQIPKCPTEKIGSSEFLDHKAMRLLDKPCYTILGRFRIMENYPNLGVLNEKPTILMAGDVPEGMFFRLPHYNWQKMLDLLKAKYGEPTLVEKSTNTTHGGAIVTGAEYKWIGKLVTLTFSEYGDTVNNSLVGIETKRLSDSSQEESKRNADAYKDKL